MAEFKINKRKIPKKLSTLIFKALNDLNWVEKNPKRFRVNMDVFHELGVANKCIVCFAGAFFAGTLKWPDETIDFNLQELVFVFYALDDIRTGNIRTAVNYYYNDNIEVLQKFSISNISDYAHVPLYSGDRRGFKLRIRKIANQLKKAGL